MKSYISTQSGRFRILNSNETIQSELITTGVFEKINIDFASVFFKSKAGSVIDVGANIGAFCVPLALTHSDLHFTCFEAQQSVFDHLKENIEINGLERQFVLNNLAVGNPQSHNETISVPVFDAEIENYTGSVSLDDNAIKIRASTEGVAEPSLRATNFSKVSLVSLDTYFKDSNETISVIKIDVEGMELAVLKGAVQTVKKHSPSLIFEAWTIPAYNDARSELLSFVQSLGYEYLTAGENCYAFDPAITDKYLIFGELANLGYVIN